MMKRRVSRALRRVEGYGRVFTEAVEFEPQEGRREVVLAKAHPALGAGQTLAESSRLAALLKVIRDLTGTEVPRALSADGAGARPPLRRNDL